MENIEFKVSQCFEGEICPLKTFIELKQLEEKVKAGLEAIKDLAMDEARKYPSKTFQFHNAEVTMKNGSSRYDFSKITAYNHAKKKLKYIEDIAKAGGGVDPDTGEVIEKGSKIEGAETISIRIINA